MRIPKEATTATVKGIEMQMIDNNKRLALLKSDPEDSHIHQCALANGIFLADIQNGQLLSLYKIDDPHAVDLKI